MTWSTPGTCSTRPGRRARSSKLEEQARPDFDADENLRLALAHLVQTIGEAARHITPAFQEVHPSVPWGLIVGMRHKVVHDYLHVDYDIVWDVVTSDLPPLVVELERIVPTE